MPRRSPMPDARRSVPRGEKNMNETVRLEPDVPALLVIDPYNDFISEGGKVWDRLRGVAEANKCVPLASGVCDPATPTDNATTAATSPADAHATVSTPTGRCSTLASASTGTIKPTD